MIVTCPRCFATYNVPDRMLASGARKVRCSGCRFEWSEAPMPQEAIAGLAPEPLPAAAVPSDAAPEPTYVPPPPPASPAASKPPVRRATAPKAPKRELGAGALWSVFILATLLGALVLAREPLGHKATWMADLYEMIGLPVEGPNDWFRFEDIALEKSAEAGQTVLIVRGKIVNQSRRSREIPTLRLFWRDKSGEIGPLTELQARPEEIGVDETALFNGELRGVDASMGGEVKVTFIQPGETAPAGLEHSPASAGLEHSPAPDHNASTDAVQVPVHASAQEAPVSAAHAPGHQVPALGAPAVPDTHEAPALPEEPAAHDTPVEAGAGTSAAHEMPADPAHAPAPPALPQDVAPPVPATQGEHDAAPATAHPGSAAPSPGH